MIFNMTERVAEAWDYYDRLLDTKLERIANMAEVERDRLNKINPAEFIEKTQQQKIDGYEYRKVEQFIAETKTDDNFLISPMDADEETANQISYKSRMKVRERIRASKCEIYPVPKETALDFFIRHHRQGPPAFRKTAVCLGLVKDNELLAVMHYDISNGAVRGNKKDYELVRLSIRRETQIYGGASKLQKACEETLRQMGVSNIYSYSNATINTGGVYKELGFDGSKVMGGQPFVIMGDNSLVRLIELYPNSTDVALAKKGRLKTHVGGNRFWVKNIKSEGGEDGE